MRPALLLLLIAGCARLPATDPDSLPGLHNVLPVSGRVFSGSAPVGDAAFGSLQKLDVRMIISVDGAVPDVEAARRHGIVYVHLPIGYDGVPRERALQIAKAIQSSPGAVYLHCHHGKHRGPAAVVVACRLLEPAFSADDGEAFLHRAGTDPRYLGLWAAVRDATPADGDELARIPSSFPEVAPVAPMTAAMVRIDEAWSRLQSIQKAQWDGDPRPVALLLREEFRELRRLGETGKPMFEAWLRESEAAADVIANGGDGREPAFEAIRVRCAQCHAAYRDNPMW